MPIGPTLNRGSWEDKYSYCTCKLTGSVCSKVQSICNRDRLWKKLI